MSSTCYQSSSRFGIVAHAMKFYWLLAIAIGVTSGPAYAVSGDDSYDRVISSVNDVCLDTAQENGSCLKISPGCWKPAAATLREIPDADNLEGKEHELFAYYFVAKSSYWAGNYAESLSFFEKFRSIKSSAELNNPLPMGEYDEALVHIAMKNYEKALQLIDKTKVDFSQFGSDFEPVYMIIPKAVSLIGLGRKREADELLAVAIDKLDFSEHQEEEMGWPFAVNQWNSYEFGIRVAAHYIREGRLDAALKLAEILEEKRAAVMSEPKSNDPRPTLAEQFDPAEFLYIKAVATLDLGDKTNAENIFEKILTVHRGKDSPLRKKALLRLAKLKRSLGHQVEAKAFEADAASIPTPESCQLPNMFTGILDFLY